MTQYYLYRKKHFIREKKLLVLNFESIIDFFLTKIMI